MTPRLTGERWEMGRDMFWVTREDTACQLAGSWDAEEGNSCRDSSCLSSSLPPALWEPWSLVL
jgi:hypothetical protein